MGEGSVEHLQVNVGILVASEADVANLARFLRGHHRFKTSARAKDAGGIAGANDFMELEQVEMVGL